MVVQRLLDDVELIALLERASTAMPGDLTPLDVSRGNARIRADFLNYTTSNGNPAQRVKLETWDACFTHEMKLLTRVSQVPTKYIEEQRQLLEFYGIQHGRPPPAALRNNDAFPSENAPEFCYSCNSKATAHGGLVEGVDFTKVSVGIDADYFSAMCNRCHINSVIKLRLYFSVYCADPLSCQKRFMEELYFWETPVGYASDPIGCDHDPPFKAECIAEASYKGGNGYIRFLQEFFQGRCVAIGPTSHPLLDRTPLRCQYRFCENQLSQEEREARSNYLKDMREDVDITILIHMFNQDPRLYSVKSFFSLERFMRGCLFWGKKPDGTRRSLQECKENLEELIRRQLNFMKSIANQPIADWTEEQCHVFWVFSLATERKRLIVSNRKSSDTWPFDLTEALDILEKAYENGWEPKPIASVTEADIENLGENSEVEDSDDGAHGTDDEYQWSDSDDDDEHMGD